MEKKNTGLIIFVIILILLVVGLGGFIIYNKFILGDQPMNPSNNSVNDKTSGTIDESQNNNSEDLVLENYLGQWYESEQHYKDQNPNSMIIRKINNNKVTFDLYITRTAGFNDVNVYINNNYGTFEAISYNGPTSSGNLGKITGNLQLSDNTIKLTIEQTDIMYLAPGTKYTFTYKR